jgi:hypothetical protein
MKNNRHKRPTYLDSKLILFTGLLLLGFSSFAQAFERTMPVSVRDGKKLAIEDRTLTDLTSDNSFDGTYFRVVKAESEDTICFDDLDEKLKLRAATVYYHMTIAREYYLTLNLADPSTLNRKVTIRVDQDKKFSEALHFKSDGTFQYNGALTVPASEKNKLAKGYAPWETETWFFKAQVVKRESPLEYAADGLNCRDFKNVLMGQMLYTDMISVTQGALNGVLDPIGHLISMGFSIGLSEIIPQTLALLGKVIKQRYYLDTALIPEISIHEYGHLALGPIFGFTRSTALNEGFPNYFASKITGLKKLGARAHQYSHGDMPKSSVKNAKYSFDQEMLKEAAHGSFTFSLLMDLDKKLSSVPGVSGEDILVRTLNSKYLHPDSGLKGDLEKALFAAIQELPNQTQRTKDDIWEYVLDVLLERKL